MPSVSRKQLKYWISLSTQLNPKKGRLYKTLKCKAIHFPKPACSGFNNMGWALPAYLLCCIFKAAILKHYIFFHYHEMRLADRVVVNTLRIKIGRVP